MARLKQVLATVVFASALILFGQPSQAQSTRIVEFPAKRETWSSNNPCLDFGMPNLVSDPKIVDTRLNALAELDRLNKTGATNQSVALLAQAFGLEPSFIEDFFSRKLHQKNFDGKPPVDYALWLRGGGSSGGYTWKVALRQGDIVAYQEFEGFYRGLNNTLYRAKRAAGKDKAEGQRRIKLFLEGAGIDKNPQDVDGDGLDDLIIHLHFELSARSLAGLTYLPVPYFWNGERLACSGVKPKLYYIHFLEALNYLSWEDSEVIRSQISDLLDLRDQGRPTGNHSSMDDLMK